MPKLKTHKGITKRIRVSKSGLVKAKRCGYSHLSSGKTSKNKRQARGAKFMSSGEAKRLSKMLHRRMRGRDSSVASIRRSPSPEAKRATAESSE